MSNNDIMLQVERRATQKEVPQFEIGDTVDVHVRIQEGDKSRIQLFTGIVIGRKHGGLRETFTVRRIVDGEGVERTFPIHAPAVVAVKVKRRGIVRRAKLYFLRDRVGKATRLKERIGEGEAEVAVAEDTKKKTKKRGAKAKAERKARQAAEVAAGGGKKKGKKKKEKEAETAGAEAAQA